MTKLLDDNAMKLMGHFYKCRVQVANARVIITAELRKIESIKKNRAAQLATMTRNDAASKSDAIDTS